MLVIYRDDHKFLLDPIIPKPGGTVANYDLVIASQPYRARASIDFKAKRVIAPLARALGPGGRLLAIHSYGHDPGMEIIQKVWPGDNPFTSDRHQILKAVKNELGPAGRDLNFNAYADNRSLFRYEMHTLPSEVSESIGTSTAFAAWNAAIYVAQIEDDRLGSVVSDGRYLEATREVLRKHGGLWFYDESYVISRRRTERCQENARFPSGSRQAMTGEAPCWHLVRPRTSRRKPSRRSPRSCAAARSKRRGRPPRTWRRCKAAAAPGTQVYLSAVPTRPQEDVVAQAARRARGRARAGAASGGAQLRQRRRARAFPRPADRRGRRAPPAGDRGRPRRAGRAVSRRARGDRLRTDLARGIEAIGISGYPDGHPRIADHELDRAARRQARSRRGDRADGRHRDAVLPRCRRRSSPGCGGCAITASIIRCASALPARPA